MQRDITEEVGNMQELVEKILRNNQKENSGHKIH